MNLRAVLARTLCLPVLTVGCSPATKITATAWEASPDGEWLTRVARYDSAGPGINALYEEVELKRRSTDKGVALLTLDEGSVLPDDLNGSPVITLHWRDPSHLEIAYRAGKIDHQIVKLADVSVETRRSVVQR